MTEVQLIRSGRKSISVQIKPDGTVVVRAPYRMAKRDVERFLTEKQDWIDKHLRMVRERERKMEGLQKFSQEEIRELANRALIRIPQRVRFFAPIVGVDYRSVTIRNQKTRWGSCSAKGGLNFNCLLMLAPPEVLDYVVVHELCHRKEMNHSKAFWNEVEKVLPDYRKARAWLKEEGSMLMRRMTG